LSIANGKNRVNRNIACPCRLLTIILSTKTPGLNMKIAAIDIGTNSIHMVIVRVEKHRIFEIIDREKEMVFLGKGSLLLHRLTEENIQRGLAALKALKGIADSHQVDRIICTATSAVREASNGKEFVKMIKEATGIQVQVLSGTEEARMITLSVRDYVDLKDRRALICDIGGGSMELIVADARHIYFAQSVKSGVIRLTERFMRSDPPSSKEIKKLRKWLKRKLEPLGRQILNLSPEIAIGTSGTMLAMGQLIQEKRKGSNFEKDRISIEEVEEMNEALQKLSLEERLRMPGLDKKRADQIIAGGVLIESVMEICRINELMLCDRALREGLIANYLIKQTPSVPATIQARELRRKSVLNLLNRWDIDIKHCEHTSKLSLYLYDALQPFHQYGPSQRELLEYSALLHDIGRVISYPEHDVHGWYIVKNSNLIGFSPAEIEILAAVVGYHRKRKPKKRDELLRDFKKSDRKLVRFLSGILRVADALDRQHNQQISKISATTERQDQLAIFLYSTEPAFVPLRAAVQKSALLQKSLKIKELDFRVERQAASIRLTAS
jgi:exopolyphosphatase/guanosine-5'-triphosphate,3'-diphosphate pyrophosphatase